MEFKFAVNDIFKEPLVEINHNLIPPGFSGDRRAYWDTVGKVSEVINAMGEASAAAQGLTKPITTAERLRNSEHTVFLLIDRNAGNGRGAVTGMLKTGKKGLYVFDRNGQHYQVSPPCVLDFYVHESRQRTGLGKQLFEHMLQKEEVEPVKMAIDRPSEKFLGFLNKHYNLNNPVKQMNNYVVFDGFFPKSPEKNGTVDMSSRTANSSANSSALGRKESANGLQTMSFTQPMGRYGAPRPHCSMGQIIHNQSSTIPSNSEPAGVKSAPVLNQQTVNGIQSPANVTCSTPNMTYHLPVQQQPAPISQLHQNQYIDPQYYQQQESANVWHTLGKSEQIPYVTNSMSQANSAFGRQNFNPEYYANANQAMSYIANQSSQNFSVPQQGFGLGDQIQQNQYSAQTQQYSDKTNYTPVYPNVSEVNNTNMNNSYMQQVSVTPQPQQQPMVYQQNTQFASQVQPSVQQFNQVPQQTVQAQPSVQQFNMQISESSTPQQTIEAQNEQPQPVNLSHIVETPSAIASNIPQQANLPVASQTVIPTRQYPLQNIVQNQQPLPNQTRVAQQGFAEQVPQQIPPRPIQYTQPTISTSSMHPQTLVQSTQSNLQVPNVNIQNNLQPMSQPTLVPVYNMQQQQQPQQNLAPQSTVSMTQSYIPPQTLNAIQQSQPNYYTNQPSQHVLQVPNTNMSYEAMPEPQKNQIAGHENPGQDVLANIPQRVQPYQIPIQPAEAQNTPDQSMAQNQVQKEPNITMSKSKTQSQNSTQYNILNHQPIIMETQAEHAKRNAESNVADKSENVQHESVPDAKGDMRSITEEESLMFKWGYPPQSPSVFTNTQNPRSSVLTVKTR